MTQKTWYKNSLIDRYLFSHYRNKGYSEKEIQRLAVAYELICTGIILVGFILFLGGFPK